MNRGARMPHSNAIVPRPINHLEQIMPNDIYILTLIAEESLQRLGYWQEADDAEKAWEDGKSWTPVDLELPLGLRQDISTINLCIKNACL